MSFISRTCLVPTIIVFILAFPHYMLNLLLREGRRCGVLQRRILGVRCSLDDLFVVFGVFHYRVWSWESFILLQDNYSCNKYTICDVYSVFHLYYPYVLYDLFVVFGVFHYHFWPWESFILLQDNYSCNKYTICDVYSVFHLYYSYV
jgi:hypothetical protein